MYYSFNLQNNLFLELFENLDSLNYIKNKEAQNEEKSNFEIF